MRTYTSDGSVKSERVKVGNAWVERPSSITGELAHRSLTSFLREKERALRFSQLPVAAIVSVDTVDGTPVTMSDSLWTDSPAGAQFATKDSDSPGIAWTGDIYYSDATLTGDIGQSTSGAMVTTDPSGGDEFIETVYTGGDWLSALQEIDAQLAAYGSLREDQKQYSSSTPAESTDTVLHLDGGNVVMASTLSYFMEKANCTGYRNSAGWSFVVALGAGAGAVTASLNPGTSFLSPRLGRIAIGSFVSGVGKMLAYRQCLRDG